MWGYLWLSAVYISQKGRSRSRTDYAIITDMEPKLPTPQFSPESLPTAPGQSYESAPAQANPEVEVNRGERPMEQRSEASPVAAPPVLPTPVVVQPTPVVNDATAVQGANPSVAGDDDLIEKEWVDRAKKIIDETHNDPHKREQEVARLQADYLRKRYGKELGAADAA